MVIEDRFPELTKRANGRDTLPTKEAAYAINRKPQTLRRWACSGGPIESVLVNGRREWGVSDLRSLLSGSVK
jgi:hypothetical protein